MDGFVSAPKMIMHGFIKKSLFKFNQRTVFDKKAIQKLQATVGIC